MRRLRIGAFGKLGVGAYLALAPLLFSTASSVPSVIEHSSRLPVASGGGFRAAISQSGWASTNWSGYAETGLFTGITSTWTVPAVAYSPSTGYSSTWIGIDGFNNSNLIQVGTEQDYYSGKSHYYSWWEVLPAAQTSLSTTKYPVLPGDRMSADIYKTTSLVGSKPEWVISVADTTRRWAFSTVEAYSGSGTSAEWIMEAPEINGKVSALARYSVAAPAGKADFDNTGVSTGLGRVGVPPSYGSPRLAYSHDAGDMVQNRATVSAPGSPDLALSGFNIAYGSGPAPTPAS